MHPGEGGQPPQEGRSERINVGGGDDSVTRIQLAARWAEAYGPPTGDSLSATLKRFKIAFDYLDAVMHGIEPPTHDEQPTSSPTTRQTG
jgi:hypothetical protein